MCVFVFLFVCVWMCVNTKQYSDQKACSNQKYYKNFSGRKCGIVCALKWLIFDILCNIFNNDEKRRKNENIYAITVGFNLAVIIK